MKVIKIITKKLSTFHEVFNELGLRENTLYEVMVKIKANNVEHQAFLFVGFKNGSYCEVYTNNYDMPVRVEDVYSLRIIKELTDIKTLHELM